MKLILSADDLFREEIKPEMNPLSVYNVQLHVCILWCPTWGPGASKGQQIKLEVLRWAQKNVELRLVDLKCSTCFQDQATGRLAAVQLGPSRTRDSGADPPGQRSGKQSHHQTNRKSRLRNAERAG